MAEQKPTTTQPLDLGSMIGEVLGLIKEKANLRTVFDFVMDTYFKLVPKQMVEQAAEAGRHLIDQLVYSIRF
jgi:phosphoribosyl-dephospho-CoA transferase